MTPDYTPVIAVLPFTSASGDAEPQSSLGPSFAREVTSVLSTFPLWRLFPPRACRQEKLA